MEPATLTATVIAQLAFQKFLESGAGEAGKQFTVAAIAKMDDLRKSIWAKLRGRPRVEEVKTSVESTKQITEAQINQLAAYLQVAMDEDQAFAKQIQTIAHEITLMQIEDNSSMTQNNYGGTNYQTKTCLQQATATNQTAQLSNHPMTQAILAQLQASRDTEENPEG